MRTSSKSSSIVVVWTAKNASLPAANRWIRRENKTRKRYLHNLFITSIPQTISAGKIGYCRRSCRMFLCKIREVVHLMICMHIYIYIYIYILKPALPKLTTTIFNRLELNIFVHLRFFEERLGSDIHEVRHTYQVVDLDPTIFWSAMLAEFFSCNDL